LITAPAGSVTAPVIRPLIDCACAMAAAIAQQTNPRPQFFNAFITLRVIKVICVLIKPPVGKKHGVRLQAAKILRPTD
jgi:hypothetical protein